MRPEDIEQREFLVGLRGYVRDEVQAFLHSAAAAVRERDERIAELEAELDTSVDGDRTKLGERMGREVASILRAADQAASEIRDRAERNEEMIAQRSAAFVQSLEPVAVKLEALARDVRELSERMRTTMPQPTSGIHTAAAEAAYSPSASP